MIEQLTYQTQLEQEFATNSLESCWVFHTSL